MTRRSPGPGSPGGQAPHGGLGVLVVILCGVNVLVALDFLGASVLLHAIGEDLQMSTAELTWVVNGYLLMLAAPLIAIGRAADSFGAVRLTRIGLVTFALGALTAGIAGTAEVLVAGRMLQGLGASVLAATGLSLVSTAAAPENRGRVVGIWAGVGAVGSAAGPLVAGALEALGSWRIFFLIDVPFALVVLWFLRTEHDSAPTGPPSPIGLVPAAVLTIGLGAGVFALLSGPDGGWYSTMVIIPATVALGLLAWFVVLERRAECPLLDPKLFVGQYAPIAATAFVGNAAFAVVSFFASLYLQQVQGLDPVAAGAVFLAMTFPLVVLSPRVGAWTTPTSKGALMGGGLVVVAASVGLFAVLGTNPGITVLVVALVLTGIGQSLVFNVSNIGAMAGAGPSPGLESGVINEIRQLGALIGLALVGALFAALQRSANGSGAEKFVDSLRLPSILLAAACVITATFVLIAGRNDH